MTTMEGSSFEENPILELEEEEESWQPERAGRGVLYSIGGEGGSVRARGRESGRKSKKASKRAVNFGSSLALHAVELVQDGG
ncbi:hypothetical protein LTR72_012025, partial [Exophiala xenobiotica]